MVMQIKLLKVLLLLTLAAVALQRESYNFNLKRRSVLYLFPASIRPSALTLELYYFFIIIIIIIIIIISLFIISLLFLYIVL